MNKGKEQEAVKREKDPDLHQSLFLSPVIQEALKRVVVQIRESGKGGWTLVELPEDILKDDIFIEALKLRMAIDAISKKEDYYLARGEKRAEYDLNVEKLSQALDVSISRLESKFGYQDDSWRHILNKEAGIARKLESFTADIKQRCEYIEEMLNMCLKTYAGNKQDLRTAVNLFLRYQDGSPSISEFARSITYLVNVLNLEAGSIVELLT